MLCYLWEKKVNISKNYAMPPGRILEKKNEYLQKILSDDIPTTMCVLHIKVR